MTKTPFADKYGRPIKTADKLIDEHGYVYEIWFDDEIGWLIRGGVLSGDDPKYYVHNLVVIKNDLYD